MSGTPESGASAPQGPENLTTQEQLNLISARLEVVEAMHAELTDFATNVMSDKTESQALLNILNPQDKAAQAVDTDQHTAVSAAVPVAPNGATAAPRPRTARPAAANTASDKGNKKNNVVRTVAIGALAVTAAAGLWAAGVFGSNSNSTERAATTGNTPATTRATAGGGNANGSGAKTDRRGHNENASADNGDAQTAKEKRIANVKEALGNKTVAQGTYELHSTKATVKKNIDTLFDNDAQLKLNNSDDSMSSLRDKFENGKAGSVNYAEALTLSALGSNDYAAKAYNNLHGNSANTLPKGVTNAEALKSLHHALTAEGTTFKVINPKDVWVMNHGTNPNTNEVFNAGLLHLQGDTEVFQVKTKGGATIWTKVENNCLNILDRVEMHFTPATPATPNTPATPPKLIVRTPGTPATPATPNTPATPHAKTPPATFVPGKKTPVTPETPGKKTPKTPETPHTPKTPKTPETPVTPPANTPAPKHDPNTTPGGVPGQNGGTPSLGGEGKGPAGQTPDGSAYVPGEQHPETPAPAPTPAPLETTPAPNPSTPAESGNDGAGAGQAPGGSTSDGTNVTGSVNPQG